MDDHGRFFGEEKHTYYHTCPKCGANLDPGETCDCQSQDTSSMSTGLPKSPSGTKQNIVYNDITDRADYLKQWVMKDL